MEPHSIVSLVSGFYSFHTKSMRFSRLAQVAAVLFHCCVVFHSTSHHSALFSPQCCLFLSLLTCHILEGELLEGAWSLFVLLPAVSLAPRAMPSTPRAANEYLLNKWTGSPLQNLSHLINPWGGGHPWISKFLGKGESSNRSPISPSALIVFGNCGQILIWFDYLSCSACGNVEVVIIITIAHTELCTAVFPGNTHYLLYELMGTKCFPQWDLPPACLSFPGRKCTC